MRYAVPFRSDMRQKEWVLLSRLGLVGIWGLLRDVTREDILVNKYRD